jgi:uncharacterized protein YndB with AHSA1/START domain
MMRKILVRGGLALAAVVVLLVAIGYALPEKHVASRDALVNTQPEWVFATLVDVAQYPHWREDVSRVEVVSTAPLRWKEHAGGDVITFEAAEVDPPRRLVTRIADPDLPFGGTWTFELAAEGASTRVRITERGEVYNPVFRFMSRFVFGHTAGIEAFLRGLRQRFGDRAQSLPTGRFRHPDFIRVTGRDDSGSRNERLTR